MSELLQDQSLASNGNDRLKCKGYEAVMQGDGNFCVYDNGSCVWASNTWHRGEGPWKLIMQGDGNLVVYDSKGVATWASNTYHQGVGPWKLIMQGDRNLVVYDSKGTPTWASGTYTSQILTAPPAVVSDDMKNEFIQLQRFAMGVKSLPDSPYGDVQQLLTNVKDSATSWDNDIKPQTIRVADGVISYVELAKKSVKDLDSLNAVYDNADAPHKDAIRNSLIAMFNALILQAQNNERDVEECAKKIGDLTTKIADYKNKSQELETKYQRSSGDESVTVQNLNREIADLRAEIGRLNDEYQDCVVKASTSVTYAWIWPFGTIAAASVAGVYGKKATDLKGQINGKNGVLGNKVNELSNDQKELQNMNLATQNLNSLFTHLQGCQTALEKDKGTWNAIQSDLENDITTLKFAKDDVFNWDMLHMDIAIAHDEWDSMEKKAQDYKNSL